MADVAQPSAELGPWVRPCALPVCSIWAAVPGPVVLQIMAGQARAVGVSTRVGLDGGVRMLWPRRWLMTVLSALTFTDLITDRPPRFLAEVIGADGANCEVEVRLDGGDARRAAGDLVRVIAGTARELRARGARVEVGQWEQFSNGERFSVSWGRPEPRPRGSWPPGWVTLSRTGTDPAITGEPPEEQASGSTASQ